MCIYDNYFGSHTYRLPGFAPEPNWGPPFPILSFCGVQLSKIVLNYILKGQRSVNQLTVNCYASYSDRHGQFNRESYKHQKSRVLV